MATDHTPPTSARAPQYPDRDITPDWIVNDLRHHQQQQQKAHQQGGQYRPYVRSTEADPYQTPRLRATGRAPQMADPDAPYPVYVPPQNLAPAYGDYSAYGHNAYGHRARQTVPMDYQPLMNDDIEVRLRGKCRNCYGNGTVPGRIMQCSFCTRRHSYEAVKQAHHYGWRGRRVLLPCQHEMMEEKILWTRPQCMICEGEGYLYQWITWGEFIAIMYPEELDEQTTAALRALGRAVAEHQQTPQQQPQPRRDFYQSEPSAPTPHLGTGAPTPSGGAHQATPTMLPPLPPVPDDNPSQF